jgi:hypothetical protein
MALPKKRPIGVPIASIDPSGPRPERASNRRKAGRAAVPERDTRIAAERDTRIADLT